MYTYKCVNIWDMKTPRVAGGTWGAQTTSSSAGSLVNSASQPALSCPSQPALSCPSLSSLLCLPASSFQPGKKNIIHYSM